MLRDLECIRKARVIKMRFQGHHMDEQKSKALAVIRGENLTS